MDTKPKSNRKPGPLELADPLSARRYMDGADVDGRWAAALDRLLDDVLATGESGMYNQHIGRQRPGPIAGEATHQDRT